MGPGEAALYFQTPGANIQWQTVEGSLPRSFQFWGCCHNLGAPQGEFLYLMIKSLFCLCTQYLIYLISLLCHKWVLWPCNRSTLESSSLFFMGNSGELEQKGSGRKPLSLKSLRSSQAQRMNQEGVRKEWCGQYEAWWFPIPLWNSLF